MGGVLALLKHLPTILPAVIEAVKLAESIFGRGKGEVKKAWVVSAVKSAILAIEGLSQKDIVDDQLFSEGVGDVVDGVVKILNATGKFGRE
jgi:hypothetical protein